MTPNLLRSRRSEARVAGTAFAGAMVLLSSLSHSDEPRKDEAQASAGALPNLFGLHEDSHIFPDVGSTHTKGFTNSMGIMVRQPITDSLSIMIEGSTDCLGLSNIKDATLVRTLLSSGAFDAGLSYTRGNHTIFGTLSGGYVRAQMIGGPDAGSLESPKAGMKLGYDYKHTFGAVVSGNINPLNPLGLYMYGASPWGWVDEAKPRANVSLGWLRIPDQDNHFMNGMSFTATIKIPILKIKSFVPQAMTIIDGDLSGNPRVYFGGSVMTFLPKSVNLETGGAASTDGVGYLLLAING
jgi:hypothetical protein